MQEKCPCETYATSCCACVSMHCDECHGHSKFVQGRFCSNCGRPLKAELTRLYVPKSEVEELKRENESLAKTVNEASELIRKQRTKIDELKKDRYQILPNGNVELIPRTDIDEIKRGVAREIFEEIESLLRRYTFDNDYISLGVRDEFAELKKKYTEGE